MAQYFPFFYHRQMRKYAAVFGTIFNDLRVKRFDANGNELETKIIPFSYGPRDKALAREDEEPQFNERKAAIFLPRMTYQITSLAYDPNRKLIRQNYIIDKENGNTLWTPAPWNILFDLTIGVSTIDEGNQIIEQILPMFNSDITTAVEILPGVIIEVPLILEGISQEDTYLGDMNTRREIRWTLNFTMMAQFFGPTQTRKLIRFVEVGTHTDLLDNTTGEVVQTYPGLDANGQGTSDPAQAIDWAMVNSDDPWKVIVEIQDAQQ